jgi:phosphoribosylformylglycinamidine synthase
MTSGTVLFFRTSSGNVIAVRAEGQLTRDDTAKLSWLFGNASLMEAETVSGTFIGPRREMITPWSTNAVEITQNMAVTGISRIEEYFPAAGENPGHDPCFSGFITDLTRISFTVHHEPEPVREIDDIAAYNAQEGLALSADEIRYLENLSRNLGRKLTDSEVFGFSQVNSEHCRHKIFNGTFIIDGEERKSSLFDLIKRTTKENRNHVVSAYKDNCAFLDGPVTEQFAPATQDKPDWFCVKIYPVGPYPEG